MDVIFELQKGRAFAIEVGFFDTVLEIKEKIQKYQGIPVQNQTLIFKNQPLQDDQDVDSCEILHNSHIQLLVDTFPLKKIKITVKIPSSASRFYVEMEASDRVEVLREKIHDAESLPANRLVLCFSGTELLDNRCLHEYEISDNSEIEVSFRSSPTAMATSGSGSKKLKLMVKSPGETTKIPVEVNASENVGELRKELEKLQGKLHFHLPPKDYFFIYKQNVMEDDRSFRWHHVGQGDTIEIFNGSVSSGS